MAVDKTKILTEILTEIIILEEDIKIINDTYQKWLKSTKERIDKLKEELREELKKHA